MPASGADDSWVVVDVEAPTLRRFASRLEALMRDARGDEEQAPLDYLLGALYGLFQATRFDFKDRDHALRDERGRSPEGIPYWEYGPLTRVRLMTEGKVRVDGAWVAGFYFNSALARMAAVYDRVVKRTADEKRVNRRRPNGSRKSVRELLVDLQLTPFTQGKLAEVYDEVNRIKHDPPGLASRRDITMADATAAFAELLDLLKKSLFPDSSPR